MRSIYARGLLAMLAALFLATCILTTGSLAVEPEHDVGTGDDNWWVGYPSQSPSSGSEVEHPDWVLESLSEKPVVILCHSTDCKSCKLQISYIDKALEEYGQDVDYYDVLADEDWEKAEDVFEAYDPTGGKNYVPTTVIVTLARGSDGKVVPVWHSIETATSEEWLKSYMGDAISYYDQDSADWEK